MTTQSRSLLCVGAVLATCASAVAGVLYSHRFNSLTDLKTDGAATMQVGAAPGGKGGNARIANATNAGNAGVLLTPGVTLPSAVTIIFRFYVGARTNFQAAYNYPMGEGIRLMDNGSLQGSCGEGYTAGWQLNTWYTVAFVIPSSGGQTIYLKQGAAAVLSESDRIGQVCAGNSSRPPTYTYFFNYGGDLYIADYTINDGADLAICNGDQSFVSGLEGWSGGANDSPAWISTGGLCDDGYHQASRSGSYPAHEPYADPGRSTFTANLFERFGPAVMVSYYLKDFSTTSPGSGQVIHALIDPAHGTPYTQWQKTVLPGMPTTWTQVQVFLNTSWTDAEAVAAGWSRASGSGSWSQLFEVSGQPGSNVGLRMFFGLGTGSYGNTRTTGIDGVSIAAAQLPKPMGRYRVPLTITSALPTTRVPMDPLIAFSQLLQDNSIQGVLDHNSISVKDLTSNEFIPHRIERFANEDTFHVEWVVNDPSHTQYELWFDTVAQRQPILPVDSAPMIGVGDLLRYNAGAPRPVTPVLLSGLSDVTGDGKPDLVGMWNYGRRQGDTWDGVIVYPRVGELSEFKFGDMFRIYEVPDARYSHGDMGDFDEDGKPDIAFTPSSSNQITFYHNTGQRHATLMPVYTPSGSASRPGGSGLLMRIVDLDADGSLDVVAAAGFPNAETGATSTTAFLRNTNGTAWPPTLQSMGTLNIAGVNPAFFDYDADGRLDAVSLVVDPADPGLSGYNVAWQRNLGGSPPTFGPAQLIAEINSRVWRAIDVAAVNEGPQQGLLVQDRNWQRVQFFVRSSPPAPPLPLTLLGAANSISAELILSDQASPCITDWNGDGSWDLVVGGGYGWPEVVVNNGTNSRPSFAEAQLILSQGTPIRLLRNTILGEPGLWHNMGYPWPVYEDWDLDGLPDLVLANETNRIFWYRNIGTRQNPAFGSQQQVLVDGYPDSPALRRLSAERALTAVYPKEVEQPFFWRTRASFVDLNGDGLRDLVTMDGAHAQLALYTRYRDTQNQPRLQKWRTDPRLQTVTGNYIAGQACCADWDGDGLIDVVGGKGGGDASGTVFLYRNVGTPTNPLFADARPMLCYGRPISLTWHGPHPGVGDMNDDGKPDLLCYTEWSVYAYYSHVAVEMAQRPTYSLGAPVLVSAPPDFDLDGDVDQEDFGFLQGCYGGIDTPLQPGCEAPDLNRDGRIDGEDFAAFAACHSGADAPMKLACLPGQ